MPKLHPYQERAVSDLVEHPGRALFIDMGLGKTLIALTSVVELQDALSVARALVIAPLRVCYTTWPEEVKKWYPHLRVHNLHAKPDTSVQADLYLINPEGLPRLFGRPVYVETSSGNKRRVWQDGLWQKWQGRPEMLIVDECFPAGTPVRTADGDDAPIEHFSVGDNVMGADGRSRAIASIARKQSSVLVRVKLADGRELRVTPNHPFFTDHGWVCAANLEGRTVYAPEDVRVLFGPDADAPGAVGSEAAQILRAALQAEGALGGEAPGDRRENAGGGCGAARGSELERGCTDAGGDAREAVSQPAGDEMGADGTWWERAYLADREDAGAHIASGLEVGSRHFIGRKAAWLSNLLQGRLRFDRGEACDRSRRLLAQGDRPTGAGPQEGGEALGTRVASIQIEQLGSPVDVYTLGVYGAPHFVAAGCVVHNSTKFKNISSGRSKTLRRVLGDFERRVAMTGTPAPNGLMDLFGQLLIVDRGETLGDKITHFRDQYFRSVEIGARGKKFTKYEANPQAFDVVQELIKPKVTALEADDWIQLPEKIVIDVPVVLPKSVLDIYEQSKEGVVLETGQPLFATGGAAAKLKQIAGGRAYVGDPLSMDREVAPIHDLKLQALDELIEEVGRPMLIAYEYTCDGDAIQARLKCPIINGRTKPKDAADIFARWNRRELPHLLIQPQAASHGLNLQHGGHDIVWFTPCWDLEIYLQLNGRLARQGQKENRVYIYHLVARGTVDERVVQILEAKDATQAALMAALKEEIGS